MGERVQHIMLSHQRLEEMPLTRFRGGEHMTGSCCEALRLGGVMSPRAEFPLHLTAPFVNYVWRTDPLTTLESLRHSLAQQTRPDVT